MARPREFDIDDAVARAMDVFWAVGYDAATTDQLLEGMQLTRGSLYKAFSDKRQLFLKSLELYHAQEVERAISVLTDPSMAGTARIIRLFSSIADTVEAGDHIGCLLCTTLSDGSVMDPDIAARAMASARRLRDGFAIALAEDDRDMFPDTYAQLLLTQYVGLRVLSRARLPAAQIRDAVTAIETLLNRQDR